MALGLEAKEPVTRHVKKYKTDRIALMKKMRFNQLSKGPRNLVFIVILFVACLGLLTKLTDYTRQVKGISYSNYLKAVEEGNVKAVHVSGQDVFGVMNDGSRFEVTVPENTNNWDVLKNHNVEFSVAANSNPYNMWYMMWIAMLLIVPLAAWYFMRQARGSNNSSGGIFSMGKSKAKMFTPSMINENFSAVAGATDAKEALKDVVDFLKNPEKYRRLGARIPRGVLLVGDPGNGKTLLAKAMAGEAHCPFFSVSGSDFIEVFVGVGAARVRDLFERVRRHSPAIVFIDEIDAIGRQRGSGFGGGHDEREQTLNQLLIEMDGFESYNSAVIVVAATNMPEVLDKALLRPGRFDRMVTVDYPDETAREQILAIHSQKVKMGSDVDLKDLARETAGFSGADLGDLINKAALQASKEGKVEVGMADLKAAHKKIVHEKKTGGNASVNPMSKGSGNVKMFVPSQIKVTFADVAGMPEAKQELKDVVDFLRNGEKYRRLGARIPRGVLLVGDPGNGKTLLAKAVAGEANCPFFSVSASDFVEMYVGVGASRVRDLFTQARKHMPSIIFIDELDSIGSRRSDNGSGGSEERNQTLNQLLTELDGFNTIDSSVILIAATNRSDVLDPALVRPGRFDKQIHVPYPTLKSREEILKVHLARVKTDGTIDASRIARSTTGFSGADLANLVNEAALMAAKRADESVVTMHDFEAARDHVTLGQKMESRVMSDQEKKITAFHEAGHALVRILMPEHGDPLDKVTIVPRGGALGVTHFLPERDVMLETKDRFMAFVYVALGGRAAELLACGVMTPGAGDDFRKATSLVRRMVCGGMTDEMGPVVYDQNREYRYSEKTAERIDELVEKILSTSMVAVKELLQNHREKLDKLAIALLEKEVLYADEVYELLGIDPRSNFRLTGQES
ncbi:ATP-dependent zinc metalloprotease FtsH [Candidatus Dependentiae bacterium]|nr:ATP-dependent zinc metalloprotease FtsH [Candidatus Dependentiae bacterium]